MTDLHDVFHSDSSTHAETLARLLVALGPTRFADATLRALDTLDEGIAGQVVGVLRRALLPPPPPKPAELMPPSRSGRVPPPTLPRFTVKAAPPGFVPPPSDERFARTPRGGR